jgi:hypothetical protein
MKTSLVVAARPTSDWGDSPRAVTESLAAESASPEHHALAGDGNRLETQSGFARAITWRARPSAASRVLPGSHHVNRAWNGPRPGSTSHRSLSKPNWRTNQPPETGATIFNCMRNHVAMIIVNRLPILERRPIDQFAFLVTEDMRWQ